MERLNILLVDTSPANLIKLKFIFMRMTVLSQRKV